MQPPTHNPTFDPTALSVLADASFLDVEGTQSIDNTNSNSNSETDYGSALWPGEEHVQQDISALEQERDHLRVLLSQRQPYVATRPQHSIQTYATPLHLDLAFNSHPQTATNYQSQLQQQQQQTDTTYQQSLASPDSSAPTTPYHNMASQFSQPVTPFELHAANPLSTAAAENYNYFESSAHFSHNPPTQHNGQSQHQSSASPADEDKRQRNSAASARFRAKRKQREEALQSETRQKQQSLQQLETKVKSLEAENLFLRRLLIEKDNVEEKINDKGDETEEGERHVTGVGTSGENAAKKGKGKGREVGRK